MTIVVNISDAKTSRDTQDTIVTYSLGSCIGVALYDPIAKVGGMLHFQLPTATLDLERSRQQPLMFADSGMQVLLREMEKYGAVKRRMKVKIAGAAQMWNDGNLFNIGRRNHAAIRKILWQYGMFLDGEDIGGTAPRNLYLNVGDGSVVIKMQGITKKL